MKLLIYTDGGARGNPGPAAAAAVLINADTQKIIKKISKYLGRATNNQAEYQALILGLKEAQKLKATKIECYLDSELLVKQLNFEYKIKDKNLAPLFLKIWNLSKSFKKVSYYHIYREKNKIADKLVNEILDKKIKN